MNQCYKGHKLPRGTVSYQIKSTFCNMIPACLRVSEIIDGHGCLLGLAFLFFFVKHRNIIKQKKKIKTLSTKLQKQREGKKSYYSKRHDFGQKQTWSTHGQHC